MRLPILFNRFQMLYPLGVPPSNRVYLAIDCQTNNHVVLKFISDIDSYFESLARMFACDHLGIAPRVLENVPPYRVSHNPVLLKPELLHLLRLPALPQDETAHIAHPAANLGLLIMSYVEGPFFKDFLATLETADEKAGALAALTWTIDCLHAQDEFHGQLLPEHVLWDEITGRPSLMSLGFTPHRNWDGLELSPEHEPGSYFDVNTASDVFMLAKFFLKDHVDSAPYLLNYLTPALETDPRKRPPSDQMLEAFKPVMVPVDRAVSMQQARENPVSAATENRKPAWWVLVAFILSITGVTLVTAWPDGPITERIISDRSLSMQEKVREIRLRHNQTPDLPIEVAKQRALAADLAEVYADSGVAEKVLLAEDLSTPIAVGAYHDQPFLIGRNGYIGLGEPVTLGGRNGYIASILWEKVQVQFDGERREFTLQDPGFGLIRPATESGTLVWNRPGNLGYLLKGIKQLAAEVESWPGVLAALQHLDTDRLANNRDMIYGNFAGYRPTDFLKTLAANLNYRDQPHGSFSRAPESLPIHWERYIYQLEETSLAKFAKSLSDEFGITVMTNEEEKRIPKRTFMSKTYEEILENLGITWTVSEDSETPVIRLSMP